ncbi:phosphotransferase family protein [Streptomyces acidiscabies]|uniref:Aminoglycoside phosphotransferase family protein n=1 Tax=Streptomyces acidiscabies TaxID=42234 RepID=A0AAP6B567_9ACTN|nr:aminoglycoside phosphotransferase family protein [Streptomyces acidiscabies]MBP5941524.1 aminoglycoside phosphotransferase family protein [Streptomyces sp. LBUM 1476]MBZ3912909.1 aminoglycoside phosphotransferase family protein [Streptomyces acidiscabies]MDX2958393.1 aminoglycoside phosphotransferase family protein [Streptomyces acidiscabies]MDX3021101.1 aminoglycoside phosphotransferase family protein [Streptomyces acidiscabies]MDX3790937.1 aminoglycoside phosphotransferase family protein 
MDSTDSWERARHVLEEAALEPERLTHVTPLSGGTYNAVEELRLDDGTRYVLKVAPLDEGLRHEKQLLVAEAQFYEGAALADVPAPKVVVQGDGHLLMTAVPGEQWSELPAPQHDTLRAELAEQVARLHRITGPGYGYPSGALGPLAPDWRTAFTGMLDAVLADADHYVAQLPLRTSEIRATVRKAYDALDEVTTPCLVHFDLWPGNILIDPAAPRVTGLIDGERMFWGDPLADFVSLALLADIQEDETFLTAYQKAGGKAEFDDSARQRYALYRTYLYLIMLTEQVPRKADEGHRQWAQEAVVPQLLGALGEIEALAP